jgi:hypothetical protein
LGLNDSQKLNAFAERKELAAMEERYITLTIDRPQLTPADIEKLKEARRSNKTSERLRIVRAM